MTFRVKLIGIALILGISALPFLWWRQSATNARATAEADAPLAESAPGNQLNRSRPQAATDHDRPGRDGLQTPEATDASEPRPQVSVTRIPSRKGGTPIAELQAATQSAGKADETAAGPMLTEDQMRRMIRQLSRTKSSAERRKLFDQLMAGLSPENALQMRDLIHQLPVSSKEYQAFHRAFGALVGADAVVHGTETRKPDMAITLAGWAKSDPDAALQWFDSLAFKDKSLISQDYLVVGLVQGLAAADPAAATGFVLDWMAEIDTSDRKAGQMASALAKAVWGLEKDAVSAIAWAGALPEGPLRRAAQTTIAEQYGRQKPKKAAKWAESFAGTANGPAIIAATAQSWALKDGAAAVNWMRSLQPEAVPANSYQEPFERWAKKDAHSAGNYLIDMPASAARDHAINGFTQSAAWKHPEIALQWAGAIQDSRLRENTLIQTAHITFRKDPNALLNWLPQSGLSEKVQEKYRSGIRAQLAAESKKKKD